MKDRVLVLVLFAAFTILAANMVCAWMRPRVTMVYSGYWGTCLPKAGAVRSAVWYFAGGGRIGVIQVTNELRINHYGQQNLGDACDLAYWVPAPR